MTGKSDMTVGCSERFQELCALKVANSLTVEERRLLQEHLAQCRACNVLISEYSVLASEGMASLGASRADDAQQNLQWDRESARERLLGRIDGDWETVTSSSTNHPIISPATFRFPSLFWQRKLLFQSAAILLVAVSLAFSLGILYGLSRTRIAAVVLSPPGADAALMKQLAEAKAEQTVLNQKLIADSELIASLQARAASSEKELSNIEAVKSSLDARLLSITNQQQQQAGQLSALSREKEGLEQKQHEMANVLQAARQDVANLQNERQRLLVRNAGLEANVAELSAQVQERNETTKRQEQYLASDRDIRELMGARQLYIADVFDIDSHGETKKPFGRIFYTKGKSLIFYAFDLDQQAGYREAKAFQVWGSQGPKQTNPVSLGILYVDNETNRRWALKFRDTKILDEINTVFVTVEPHGGSKKPTAKPFLLAYLKTAAANHP